MKAGASKVDITPAGPVWLDGMIRTGRSTGCHDPIFAKALALSPDGTPGGTFVIVSVDICTLGTADSREARAAAARATGVPADHIIIATTHTHSAPATFGYFNPKEDAYVAALREKLVAVIQDAVSGLAPAEAASGSGRETTISHYRRLLADDGHVVMNWEPYPAEKLKGPLGDVDPEVGVLSVRRAGGRGPAIAVLFNHAGHPNVLSGDNFLISADYPGFAEQQIEKRCGGVAIFINGAQGTMDIDGLKDRDWSGRERAGGALADAVCDTLASLPGAGPAAVRGASIDYAIPARRITDAELAWAERILKVTGGRIEPKPDGVGDDYKALLYRRLRAAQETPIALTQTCVAVGDAAWVSVPCELFSEVGIAIKRKSPFARTYVIGLANGAIGYVPTREAIAQGGYEVDTREADDRAAELIESRSLDLLKRVRAMSS